MRSRFWGNVLSLTTPFVIAAACGGSVAPPPLSGPGGAGAPGGCAMGDSGCPCYPNQTCNTGISCLANVCLGMATGGTSSGSAGNSSQSGGGDGNASSVGGSTNPSGGSKGTTGGMPGSGGTESAGGPGSGGSQGSAGTSSVVPGNLLTNGDFSDGTNFWEIKQSASTVVSEPVTNGALCITLTSGQFYTVGWPAMGTPGVSIGTGNYVLWYQVSSTGPLPISMFSVKVGGAMPPYQADFQKVDMLTGQPQVISDPFAPTAPDSDAGLVFQINAGYSVTSTDSVQVCLDNVALAPAM